MTTADRPPPKPDISKTLGLDKAAARKPHMRRWMTGVAIAIVVLGAWAIMGWRKSKETVKYNTQPARRGDLVVTVSATGTLQPINQVDVGTEVSGIIKSVDVDYNDRVQTNQVLVRLDPSRLEAQALQSEAALASARARLLQAQATVQESEAQMTRLEKVHELSQGKMPSQSDLDAAKAALARAHADASSATATIAQAQASLDVVRTDLDKTVIRSPIAGVVLVRSVEPGQTVAASLSSPVLFTLAEDLAKMELQVDVDEADVGQVKEGQEATFTVDAYPDRTFPARVTLVRFGSQTVDGVVTYKTVLEVDNSSLILRPGMTATAVITVNKVEHAILVPNATLRFSPPPPKVAASGGDGLLSALIPHPPRFDRNRPAANANGKRKSQQVWTLRGGALTAITITKGLSDGQVTEVTEGELEPGTELVTDIVTVK
jgi:HlyD family secretion protein